MIVEPNTESGVCHLTKCQADLWRHSRGGWLLGAFDVYISINTSRFLSLVTHTHHTYRAIMDEEYDVSR